MSACVKRQVIDPCSARINEIQLQLDLAKSNSDREIEILKRQIQAKNERLSKFNQIDGKGDLRSNTWKDSKDHPIKSNEDWMK